MNFKESGPHPHINVQPSKTNRNSDSVEQVAVE